MMNSYNIINSIEDELFDMKDALRDTPNLLNDITIRSLYESLMNVQSVSELDRWMAALEKTQLSAFVRSTSPTKNWIDDCFGALHTILMATDEDQMEEVVFLIRKLKETGFTRFYHKKDVERCIAISKDIHMEAPQAIVLFRQNSNQYAAFAEDAAMLFSRYGWELSTIKLSKDQGCDFMPVYPRGYEFLCIQKDKVIIKDLDFPLDFNVTDRERVNLSDSQQTIDYFRSLITLDRMVCSSMGLSYCPVIDGLETEEKYPFIFKEGNSFGLYGEKGESLFLIQKNSWNIDEEQIPLINNLAFNLTLVMADEKRLQHFIDPTEVSYDTARSYMIMAEYLKNKADHADSILLMRSGDLAWTFMEDALELTRFKPRTIWKIGSDPVVFLDLSVHDDTLDRYHTIFVESEMDITFDELRLQPHELNIGVRSSIYFSCPRMFKTKQGDYAIQAEVDNRTIPMIRISDKLSGLIMEYPEGIMRETIIKTILFLRLKGRYDNLSLV